MSNDYDEIDDFEYLDEDEKADYNRKYLNEVERSISGLKDDQKDEVVEKFNQEHNYQRTTDGAADGRRNFLEASRAVQQEDENRDPHLKTLMDQIDKRKGEPGSAKKMLRRAMSDNDNGYFEQLKREGKL